MIGKKWIYWISLVAQWLRIHLPLQGSRAQVLVQEDSTCRGAMAHAPQLLSPCAATTEALSLEPVLRRNKSHHTGSPRTAMKRSPHGPQPEKSLHAVMETQHN